MTDKPLSNDVTYPSGYTAIPVTAEDLANVAADPVTIYRGQDHEIANVVLVHTNDSIVTVDLETGDAREL